jgi:tRNA (Thr-GGU) A37 N-methylase
MEDIVSTFVIRPIGRISSSLQTLDAAPRQADEGAPEARSPHRPNPLGLHDVNVTAVESGRLRVRSLEAIDGTPIVDVKPVLSPDIGRR